MTNRNRNICKANSVTTRGPRLDYAATTLSQIPRHPQTTTDFKLIQISTLRALRLDYYPDKYITVTLPPTKAFEFQWLDFTRQ